MFCCRCKKTKQQRHFSKYNKSWCKLCKKEYGKAYQKRYYIKNKKIIETQKKNWVIKNREKVNAYNRKYYKENFIKYQILRKKQRPQTRIYEKQKRKINPIYKLSQTVRRRLYESLKLKNFTKTLKCEEYLGCTISQLKQILEFKFQKGMSWKNHGTAGWHIDHIIPLSSAKNEEELYKLCHYTNLQPLWAKDNLKKGNKLHYFNKRGIVKK